MKQFIKSVLFVQILSGLNLFCPTICFANEAESNITTPEPATVTAPPEFTESADEAELESEENTKQENEEETKEEQELSETLLEKGAHFESWTSDEERQITKSLDGKYTHSREVETNKIVPLEANLLGDSINPLDGQLSFSQTDISLPGNSHLPVEFTRRLSGLFSASIYEFGPWRLNLPSLETMVYPDKTGGSSVKWRLTGTDKLGWHDDRCNNLIPPNFSLWHTNNQPDRVTNQRLGANYFQGVSLNAPGAWGEKIMPLPGGMSASTKTTLFGARHPKYVTKSNWKFECLSSIKNGPGQGFKGIAPNGDVYHFDTLIYKRAKLDRIKFHSLVNKPHNYINDGLTQRAFLAASRVEDIHGNWVEYHYDANGYIQTIEANDGRRIDINVTPRPKPDSHFTDFDFVDSAIVTTNGKTWQYNFSGPYAGTLQVTLPSESTEERKWIYDIGMSPSLSPYEYDFDDNVLPEDFVDSQVCDYSYWINPSVSNSLYLRSMMSRPNLARVTHPSGVTGEFILNNPNTKKLNGQTISNPVLRITNSGTTHRPIHAHYPCAGVSMDGDAYSQNSYNPLAFNSAQYTLPVAEKRLSGPGTDTQVWRYGYEQGENLVNGRRSNDPDLPETTERTILDPDGNLTVLHVIRKQDASFGKIKRSDHYVNPNLAQYSNIEIVEGTAGTGPYSNYLFQKTTETRWQPSTPIGAPWESTQRSSHLANYKANLELTDRHALPAETISTFYNQSGTDVYTIKRTYKDNPSASNYSYINPTRIESWSNITASSYVVRRIRDIRYKHFKDKWILNLPESLSLGHSQQKTVVKEYNYHHNTPLVSQTKQYGKITDTNTYHSNGQLKRQTLNVTPARWVQYDDYHRGIARKVTVTTGDKAYKAVNDFGQVTRITDFEGNCTTYDYDNALRLSLIDPCFASGQGTSSDRHSEWSDTRITYERTSGSEVGGLIDANMLKQNTQRGNYREEVYFDALQRPVITKTWDTTATNDAVYNATQYDFNNRTVFQARPSNTHGATNGFSTVYDGIGRVKTVDDNQTNAVDNQSFYLNDNRIRTRNPRGFETTTTYLGFGGPSQSIPLRIESPENVTTTFGDFTHLLQAQQIEQGGLIEYRSYNGADLCKTSRSDVGDRWYGYNSLGEVTWAVLGKAPGSSSGCYTNTPSTKETVRYEFDSRGNIKTVTYADGLTPNKTFSYNKNSQPTSLVFGDVTHQLDYFDGLVAAEKTIIDGRTHSLTYKYNNLQLPKRITYPNGETVNIAYNALGQAKSISDFASKAAYHPNGALKSHDYGNGAKFTQALNTRSIPQDILDSNGSRIHLAQTLTYDDNNNLKTLTDHIDSAYNLSLDYDDLDRLETIHDSFSGTGYVDYDTLGNIETKKVGSRTISYHYNSNRQLNNTTNGYVRNFTYDNLGNVKSNGIHNFTYNLEGHMTQTRAGSRINTYLYDGNGKRVKTNDGVGTSYSMYGQNGKLMYRYAKGKHINYMYLGGKLIARTEDTTAPIATCPSGYAYDVSGQICRASGSQQQSCPNGQSLQNNQCYTELSGTQCKTHASAIKSCAYRRNTYSISENSDIYGYAVFKFSWDGQEFRHNGGWPGDPDVHNGYVYWVGDYKEYGWEEYYDDEFEPEYVFFDYHQACRCDQDQLVLAGNATTITAQTRSPTFSCPSGSTLNNGKCTSSAGGTTSVFIHTDYLGSPVAESNNTGALIGQRMHHQPFGESIEGARDEVGYTGHKFDTDLGLSYMQARYYDPVIGRFYANDPVGYTGEVDTFNRYSYVANNPYKYSDPNGEAKLIKLAANYVAAQQEKRLLKNARARGRRAALKQEANSLRETGESISNLSAERASELLSTGKLKNMDGHHSPSVSSGKNIGEKVKIAENPNNVTFMEKADHQKLHKDLGGTQVKITGADSDITTKVLGATASVLSVIALVPDITTLVEPTKMGCASVSPCE